MKCRHCHAELNVPFIDLGTAPPSNAYLNEADLHRPEKYFPLRVLVCTDCWLVQTEDFADAADLFSADYAYFSSFSTTWLRHAEHYVAAMIRRFNLGPGSLVAEIAANDGYLLQYVKLHDIPCFGVEPTHSTAEAARAKGLHIVEDFFGAKLANRLAEQGRQTDLVAANNVLAHVPDINDFVSGFASLLKPTGVATFEFPHLLNLVNESQFDTIYHEHFSYLSLTAVTSIFESNGLMVFDVEELSTHGGSLRVFAQRRDSHPYSSTKSVGAMLETEHTAGITTPYYYRKVQANAELIKNDFLDFLIQAKREDKKVIAYGAAAKGNTLLNFAGVRPDLLRFVVDRNPAKQGKYMPGSRIPIVAEHRIKDECPDYVVILPWNLRTEVVAQLDYVRKWGGRFVTAVPHLEVA
ncbi:class I SAM-dependent methyltransferase [Geobacter sulfurreducens]|uniref:class I SAM-dependent methyltransferase n=1 Tax=Geobacter sulfurreducens TaxID=35554 RepID=UPI0001D8F172|nr:class I SAM-dependent methyltransferase [Geobacter sulfurreducens]ADI85772.1 SAM-dependent methyltransferase domain trio protein [Geobacter sulfurreducens KN400]